MKMSLVLQILVYVLVFYVFLVVFMYLQQDSFLFFPSKARHEFHGYENVSNYTLESRDGTLRGWLVNDRFTREKIVIYYGGNAEDIFLNIDEFTDIQAASLFVPYRGYGPNVGKPGERVIFGDALAVFDDVQKRYPSAKVFLIGRSLGSGVAVYVAAKRKVAGAVLLTPYDSIENVARSAYPLMPVSLLLKHRFNSLAYLRNVSCPLLIIYGGRDRVVKPERTENLMRHIEGEKEVVRIEQGDHSSIDMYPQYWDSILRFIHDDERE